jgi:hypothetical protein
LSIGARRSPCEKPNQALPFAASGKLNVVLGEKGLAERIANLLYRAEGRRLRRLLAGEIRTLIPPLEHPGAAERPGLPAHRTR